MKPDVSGMPAIAEQEEREDTGDERGVLAETRPTRAIVDCLARRCRGPGSTTAKAPSVVKP